jgi:nicotinate-nucleotide--dimethylbenzimidazole phosphoribosyltransferase
MRTYAEVTVPDGCVTPASRDGWTTAFREESRRASLPMQESVVPHGGMNDMSLLSDTLAAIDPPDDYAAATARDRQSRLAKPAGALGPLEDLGVRLAALAGTCPPPVPAPAAVAVFAGDHGVQTHGVTRWPQVVTRQMVATFLSGGAVVNALAAQSAAEVVIVDVGVAGSRFDPAPELLDRRVRPGTADMTHDAAMTLAEAHEAVEVGIDVARSLVTAGNRALLAGDMGIGNTTASAALISVFADRHPSLTTGRGSGIDDATHEHKVKIVRRALDLHLPDRSAPMEALAAVGGLEHAALAGYVLGAAALRVPVVLGGMTAAAGALVAAALAPDSVHACVAGHRTADPGHVVALAHLGLTPLTDMPLALGEGSGSVLTLPMVQAAARILHDVATLDEAGIKSP